MFERFLRVLDFRHNREFARLVAFLNDDLAIIFELNKLFNIVEVIEDLVALLFTCASCLLAYRLLDRIDEIAYLVFGRMLNRLTERLMCMLLVPLLISVVDEI